MRAEKLRNDFFEGKISKQDYINEVFECHSILMGYASFIKGTNISSLEIRDGQVVATTRDKGIRLFCNVCDKRLIPFETMNFRNYEQDEIKIILELIKCAGAKTILDIGANIGYLSLSIAKTFRDAQVYSFEPIPSTFDQLCANIKLNDAGTVQPFNYGLSNFTGPAEFYFYPEGSGNASMQQLVAIDSMTKVKTHVKMLDEVMADLHLSPDFIKCDVEGAELLVFQGGKKTLQVASPIIYTEMLRKWSEKFNYHPNDIIRYLSEFDYECFVIREGMLTSFTTVTESTAETNYVFLHKRKHASIKKTLTQLV